MTGEQGIKPTADDTSLLRALDTRRRPMPALSTSEYLAVGESCDFPVTPDRGLSPRPPSREREGGTAPAGPGKEPQATEERPVSQVRLPNNVIVNPVGLKINLKLL